MNAEIKDIRRGNIREMLAWVRRPQMDDRPKNKPVHAYVYIRTDKKHQHQPLDSPSDQYRCCTPRRSTT